MWVRPVSTSIVDVGHVIGERRRPEESPGLLVEREDVAGFRDLDHNVVLLALGNVRIDPFDELRIGTDLGVDQGPLVNMIGIPIVAGQMLIIPDELAGIDVERERAVAVELRGRLVGHGGGVSVMPLQPRIGNRIGNRPIEHATFRIVGPGQAPGRGDALFGIDAAPAVAARLAGARRVVKFPQLLAGARVMGGDEAAGARDAGAVADDLAVGHDQPAGMLGLGLELEGLGLPAQLAGARVDRHDIAVGRGEIDHVLEDRRDLGARQVGGPDLGRQVLGIIALVFPDFIARGGVDGEQAGARLDHVHHAVMDERRRFLRARRQAAGERHLQLRDIALVDLIERAVALLVIGPADLQPVPRRRIDQHLLRHRLVVGGTRAGARQTHGQGRGGHRNAPLKNTHQILPEYSLDFFLPLAGRAWELSRDSHGRAGRILAPFRASRKNDDRAFKGG
jgi:hypothetical protein